MNKTKRDLSGFLYLFHQKETNFYKIGTSRNVKRRLAQINRTTPYQTLLIESYPITDHLKRIEVYVQNQLKQYRVGGEWFIFENLDAWHKIVEQLPLIETLEMFKNTRVPNVGRPRKYTDIPDHLTPSQLALYLNITRQQAHQLLKRWRSEPHSKGHF